MKTNRHFQFLRPSGFSLVELLVVMAVIATLAAILFPAFGGIKKSGAIKKARAEMLKVAMAVEAYKAQAGHYPPDNPDDVTVNPLFYELVGTATTNSTIFQTESGDAINPSAFFGPKVIGFVNVSRGGGDEVQRARNYLVGLKGNHYLEVANGAGTGTVLGVSDKGPLMLSEPPPGTRSINPWRYVSRSPTNNPGQFDLWVDIIIGGKTNRIGNWSDRPIVVAY